MTVNTSPAKNWSTHNGGQDDPRYNACSPNLIAIAFELRRRWPASATFSGFLNLGCYGERDIRGGTIDSPHSHGSAKDDRYTPGNVFTTFERDRLVIDQQVIPFLIGNSAELGLGAIHDYVMQRIWHSGRTGSVADAYTTWWKRQPKSSATGMGYMSSGWLHLETTEPAWHNATPIPQRIGQPLPPPRPPEPTPQPEDDDMPNNVACNAEQLFDSAPRVAKFFVRDDGTIRMMSLPEWHARGSLDGTPLSNEDIGILWKE